MFQVHSTTARTFDPPFFFIASPYIAHCVCPPAGDVPLVSFRAANRNGGGGEEKVPRRSWSWGGGTPRDAKEKGPPPDEVAPHPRFRAKSYKLVRKELQ